MRDNAKNVGKTFYFQNGILKNKIMSNYSKNLKASATVSTQQENSTIENEVKKVMEEKTEEAAKAVEVKSNFLANMSHEIRTPMNAIVGLTEVLLRKEWPSEEKGYLLNIHNSGNALLNLINDLLDFSKIESGKMDIVQEAYQMSSLLNDVINMTMARMGNKGIEFLVDCDPNIPDKLYGDEIRIRQIMVNLLTNAIKFTREGGVLFQVQAREESYGINLIIRVTDSGIGIKKENLDKILDCVSLSSIQGLNNIVLPQITSTSGL